MKLVTILFLMYTAVFADKILVTCLGCVEIKSFKNLNKDDAKDSLKLLQYAAQNNCTILSPEDKIEVINQRTSYTSSGSMFSEIQLKSTGKQLYVQKKNIAIEQSGNKNKFKF